MAPTDGKETQKSAAEKIEHVLRFYVLPTAVNVFVYSVALVWSAVVIFRVAVRYYQRPAKLFSYKKRPLPPKNLNDPEYGNHCYIQLPNIKLHYVESGDKSKPLMILLHGFPEFWYSWRHQIKVFSKDYWVVAVDMRGYGDSEKPPNAKYYHMKYLVEDVKNLIEGIGKDKAIVVAHDWGGVVAWNFIARYPEMVEKFVVLNIPHPKAFRKILSSSVSQFLKSWYMFFFQLPYLPEFWLQADDLAVFKPMFRSKKNGNVLNEEDLEAYKFVYGKPGAAFGPIAYYRANAFVGFKSKKAAPTSETSQPSDLPKGLLLFGEDDIAIDVKAVEISKKIYPNLTTEIIPGACHFVQEDEPAVVNTKIKEFLSS